MLKTSMHASINNMSTKVALLKAMKLLTGIVLVVGLLAAIPNIEVTRASAEGATINVEITKGAAFKTTDAFTPNPVHVNVGDTVVWKNNDMTIHTAVSGTPGTGSTGLFGGSSSSPSLIAPTWTQRFTPTEEGEIPYYCVLHPVMTGTIIVGGNGDDLTVNTDRPVYDVGDFIVVSGLVADVQEDKPSVLVKIREEGRSVIRSDPVEIGPDGSYNLKFRLGPVFADGKSYSVIAEYGELGATTSFRTAESSTGEKITCQGLTPTIAGTNGIDFINGTRAADVIVGLAGNDIIRGFGGDDVICGGPGEDMISGGPGNDRVLGGRGSDFLFGNAGDDRMWGGTGFDRLFGAGGDDVIFGGKGRDNLKGGEGDNNLDGQDGRDILDGVPEGDQEPPGARDLFAELDGDFVVDTGDTVVITGEVEGGTEDDQIEWSVDAPGSGDDSDGIADLDNDGEFDFAYDVADNADDGVYIVKIEFEDEDPVYLYFIVDDENDNIDVETDEDVYSPGDDVTIEGNVDEDILDSDVDEVEITILDPNGVEVLDGEEADLSGDGDFSYDDFQIDDDDDAQGIYAIIVSYDGNDEGFFIFEVEGDDGGNGDSEISAEFSKSSYRPGDEVIILGSISDDNVEVGEEVFLTVEDPDGAQIEADSAQTNNDGEFEFQFDLDDDADLGTYEATLQYVGYDDKSVTFTVSSSAGGGHDGGDGSNNPNFTARLSKTSLLAGELLTVRGTVPRIISDEPVNIIILAPDGRFTGVSSFPDPDDDRTYSASLKLPGSLQEDEGYSVVISYDNDDIRRHFDIIGKAVPDGTITVKTDKASYIAGDTVIISGNIAGEELEQGEQALLQVFNSENDPYRFDPIALEPDGTYIYEMVVGGPLGVNGEWHVKVSHNGDSAETTFELTGGRTPSDV